MYPYSRSRPGRPGGSAARPWDVTLPAPDRFRVPPRKFVPSSRDAKGPAHQEERVRGRITAPRAARDRVLSPSTAARLRCRLRGPDVAGGAAPGCGARYGHGVGQVVGRPGLVVPVLQPDLAEHEGE